MTFNDLDLLRRIKNLTIGQFVKSIKVSRQTFYNWGEKGEVPKDDAIRIKALFPDFDTLVNLSENNLVNVGQILSKGLPRRPSGQKFNDILKEVCKYAGLTELIQLTKLEGERRIPYSLPKYEAVTAHTGRRSFVTNMSVMGLTAKQISLMTGHSQQRVVDIYDKTKAESNALSVVELLKGKV